jgi:hypothetical protein
LTIFAFRYARVVSTILDHGTDRQKQITLKILNWVACAKRPLKWREIQATFFIDLEAATSSYENGRLRKEVKWYCSSLIDLKKSSDLGHEFNVEFVHETARE